MDVNMIIFLLVVLSGIYLHATKKPDEFYRVTVTCDNCGTETGCRIKKGLKLIDELKNHNCPWCDIKFNKNVLPK